jgi:hypothetical protein
MRGHLATRSQQYMIGNRREPGEPLPAKRRRLFIAKHALHTASVPASTPEKHITDTLRAQAEIMRRCGIEEQRIDAEMRSFEAGDRRNVGASSSRVRRSDDFHLPSDRLIAMDLIVSAKFPYDFGKSGGA